MLSVFSSGVQKIQQKINHETGKIKDKLEFDPSISYGPLWETQENVEFCRSCDSRFQAPLVVRKHHCRSCGGVFCDACCQETDITEFVSTTLPADVKAGIEHVRLCDGCKRGECPAFWLKSAIREQLERTENRRDVVDKVVAKVAESVGIYEEGFTASKQLKLNFGSFYGEDGKARKSGNRPLPVSGYLEIHNKSSEVFCLKVIVGGGDTKFEIPRPSYVAVPPNESVYAAFNPDGDSLDLLVLHGNPNPIEHDKSIVHNTRAPGASPERISKAAQVGLFRRFMAYSVGSRGKNVLLKYKGDGLLLPRSGDSVGRVGLFSKLQGKRFAPNHIDFATNVEAVRYLYEYYGGPCLTIHS